MLVCTCTEGRVQPTGTLPCWLVYHSLCIILLTTCANHQAPTTKHVQDMRGAVDGSTSRGHRVRALAVLTACGSQDEGHTAQLVLLAVLLKELTGLDRTMAAVAESLFAGTPCSRLQCLWHLGTYTMQHRHLGVAASHGLSVHDLLLSSPKLMEWCGRNVAAMDKLLGACPGQSQHPVYQQRITWKGVERG